MCLCVRLFVLSPVFLILGKCDCLTLVTPEMQSDTAEGIGTLRPGILIAFSVSSDTNVGHCDESSDSIKLS